MKSYVTFFVIAVMSLGLVFLVATRARTAHDAPQEMLEAKTEEDAGADAGAADGAAGGAAPIDAAAAPKPPAERPLRIAALGWELVAAGVALANGDAGAAQTTPPMELAPEASLDAVEARLARGGNDPQGADVAIVPLPAFVSSYERLRALEPRVFMVVGFSHGREEMHASPGALAKPPPAADEAKLLALAPATSADANMQKAGSESATVLGLFALDLLGVAPSRLRFVPAGSDAAKAAPFAAVVRGAADDRKVAFTTADASRLVPIVAVAPKAQLDARAKAYEDWARAWASGLALAGKDAPNVARRLAAKENIPFAAGVGGAPEALTLVDRLGQIDAVTTAKPPVTVEALTQRTWQLARAGGLTTSAAPDPLPIDMRIGNAVSPPPAAPAHDAAGEADAGAAFAPAPANATLLVAYRATDATADVASVAAQIGFLAGVFDRAVFRVSAKGGEKAARTIAAAARDKNDVPASRLATAPGEPQGAFATVEILAPP